MDSMEAKLSMAYHVACNIADRLEAHTLSITKEEGDIVYGYCDGLSQHRIQSIMEGRCSLSASLEFDMAEEEARIESNIAIMKRLATI